MFNRILHIGLLSVAIIFGSCQKESANPSGTDPSLLNGYDCVTGDCGDHDDQHDDSKIFIKDGQTWLWGGENDEWHFNIDNLTLNTDNLRFGLGRETFVALMHPEYNPLSEVAHLFRSTDEFILIHANDFIKAYPIDLMREHEVINDEIDGEPIMAAYCVLADFPAVYSRGYCDQTFTFAVSGYTYSEDGIRDGRDGFILWDRDTESLWWPLIDRGVSGDMKNKPFNKDIGHLTWERADWTKVQNLSKEVLVLQYNQTMEPPRKYPRVDATQICD